MKRDREDYDKYQSQEDDDMSLDEQKFEAHVKSGENKSDRNKGYKGRLGFPNKNFGSRDRDRERDRERGVQSDKRNKPFSSKFRDRRKNDRGGYSDNENDEADMHKSHRQPYEPKITMSNFDQLRAYTIVKKEWAGAIIGHSGENIKRLRRELKMNITINTPNAPKRGWQTIDLDGPLDKLARAYHDFHQTIQDQKDISYSDEMESEARASITIYQDMVGFIIGKQGNYIKTIKQSTGANIVVKNPTGSSLFQEVQFFGGGEQVAHAFDLAIEYLSKYDFQRLIDKGLVVDDQQYQQGQNQQQKQIQKPQLQQQQQQQQQIQKQQVQGQVVPTSQPHIVISGPVAQMLLKNNAVPQALVMKGDGTIQNVRVYVDQGLPNQQNSSVMVNAANQGIQAQFVQQQPQNGQMLQAIQTPQGLQYINQPQQQNQQYIQQQQPQQHMQIPVQQQQPVSMSSSAPQNINQQQVPPVQQINNIQQVQPQQQNQTANSQAIQQQLQNIMSLLGNQQEGEQVNLQNLDLQGILKQLQNQGGGVNQQQINHQANVQNQQQNIAS